MENSYLKYLKYLKILVAGAVAILLMFLKNMNNALKLSLAIFAYLLIAYETIINAFKKIFKEKEIFNENLLMTVASIGAFAIGKYEEAIFVMLLNEIGEILEDLSVQKSRETIIRTIDLRSKVAHLYTNNTLQDVAPKSLKVGDKILIKTGELVPVDCLTIKGEASLDTSSMTGEFMPQMIGTMQNIISGCTVISGNLTCIVKKTYEDSSANKMIELIENSENNKSKAELFITKFSKIYTPIIFIFALLLFLIPTIINIKNIEKFGYIALMFLVISCPCAIIISVPLAYFLGIGQCARYGLVIKGANYLEKMNEIDCFVFDKTGTLTTGDISIKNFEFIGQKEYVLELLCAAESCSTHPISKAILKQFNTNYDVSKIRNIQEIAGSGIAINYENERVLVGNEKLLKKYQITQNLPAKDVFLAINDSIVASFNLSDTLKDGAHMFIQFLQNQKILCVLLSGDRLENVKTIANELNITNFEGNLLPIDKYEKLQKLKKDTKCTAFIGDGINDAPSIRSADLGFAIGVTGSDITIENADVVLLKSDLKNIVFALKIAKRTRIVSIFNIIFALIIKIVFLGLAIWLEQLWIAVLGDVGLSIFLVVLTYLTIAKKHEKL